MGEKRKRMKMSMSMRMRRWKNRRKMKQMTMMKKARNEQAMTKEKGTQEEEEAAKNVKSCSERWQWKKKKPRLRPKQRNKWRKRKKRGRKMGHGVIDEARCSDGERGKEWASSRRRERQKANWREARAKEVTKEIEEWKATRPRLQPPHPSPSWHHSFPLTAFGRRLLPTALSLVGSLKG